MALRIEIVMTLVLASMCLVIGYLCSKQKLHKNHKVSTWIAPKSNLCKHQFEKFALAYTVVWIFLFGIVVVTQAYESFTEYGYLSLCTSLSLPFLLQPILYPLSAEAKLPLFERYSFKANVWIFIFSFIGNYWYTHYFYCVLKAKYTFPAHRLNDVPIALFFATHFYFVTYHTFSNLLLRKIETRYAEGAWRTALFVLTILAFSYFTAFMETLTISSFPYYSFEDRYSAYTLGSAFYGLYFIVSFPVFYLLDEKVGTAGAKPHSVFQTVMEAMGTSMIVLLLLDFCRIALGIPLDISGVAYYIYPGLKA